LNMGDCFTYAIAKAAGLPLLFVGNDFGKTDLPAA
jgi:ribonuclease VapC